MLKHKSLVMVSVLVLVLAVVAMSCAPAKPAPPPTPPAPPVVTPPVVTPPVAPPVVTPPAVTPPAATTPPAAPAIVEKVTSYTSQKFSNDTLSIAYPADLDCHRLPKFRGAVFYGKGGKDNVFVAVRPATDFQAAASTFLADLIAASGANFSPSIDNVATVTLADGTKANVILLSAAFGMAKAAITGVIKGGNAIMVVGASDPGHLALYQEIGSTLIVK